MSRLSKEERQARIKKRVVNYTDEHGGSVRSRETKRKRVETYKDGTLGEGGWSRQVTKRNPKDDTEFIKKTKTHKDGVTEVEKENKRVWKRKVGGKTVDKYNKKKNKWTKGAPVEPAMPVKYDDLGPQGKKIWKELRK